MTFPTPQISIFLSSGRDSKTQAVAMQSKPLGITVVFWFLFFFVILCLFFMHPERLHGGKVLITSSQKFLVS